jgi:hypothetical protein
LTVREALACCTRYSKSTVVIVAANLCSRVVTKIKYRQVTVKVFFVAILVDAPHAAFED